LVSRALDENKPKAQFESSANLPDEINESKPEAKLEFSDIGLLRGKKWG